VLEEVRMLSGVETTKEKVLRIILAGQPELNEKLDAPELVQLAQRIRLRFHLGTLTPAEMRAYVQHRLEVAGAGDRAIFSEDTYPEIFRYTGGVPRLINTLCDTAMMAAYGVDRDHVIADDITSSVQELRWVEFSARMQAASRSPSDTLTGRSPQLDAVRTDWNRASDWSRGADSTREIVGRLIVATEGRTISDLTLKVGRIILGRTPDNDVQIDSRFVSRHHCQIITTAHGSVIEDLNSTNGIYVQGKRMRRHNLNDGDVVVIGKHELMYVDERLPARRASLSETSPEAQD
jgi:hypothetical protein